MSLSSLFFFFFFFNDTATTEIYTLSLHDALPIYPRPRRAAGDFHRSRRRRLAAIGHIHRRRQHAQDRKSTRLNSSHSQISYAVFCLKKKKKKLINISCIELNSPLHLTELSPQTSA